ncbi:U-box domain-containing protein 35-like isoform X2 [Rhodamnia argentea]|uniref:RING-type E3 ubiquitin transferase n=1 Tax=Rhodamnia argentea TaxID=178133 RepID=A0ABM3HC79_9MYRT|nr:U-box domain-containing protein 35-like isoform X2 [Rhodamnia argentea]
MSRTRIRNTVVASGTDVVGDPADGDSRDLFVVYRGYCARKGVQIKEMVVEENDVAKGLLEYIANNCITSIVMGAASRNTLARKLKYTDVATSVSKSAPDFCSVYVISKGKVVSVRQARRPVVNTATPPRQPNSRCVSPICSPEQTKLQDSVRGNGRGRRRSMGSDIMDKNRVSAVNLSVDNLDLRGFSSPPQRNSLSDESDISGSLSFGSMDLGGQRFDFSMVESDPLSSSSISQSSRELEAEMNRLKLELKQTMDMYSNACKEAISAKKQAEELHMLKIEEARRFEEARLAEEAALAVAEMEKAKCKAAIEAAEKAQRLAEMEGQRRRHAEMKAKLESKEKVRALSALHQNDTRYRKYTIEEIEEATDKFAKTNKIGEGGYGPVYKGKLDHTPVAIKVLRPDAVQGKKQFHQEVEVLSCMRHPNMVLLLGACPEYGCLVYEYMDFGSLEDRLFRKGKTPPISWQKRFNIAAEIATALLFLHQSKPEPLVHRDLKPANILLDRNYKSKISDVGLARLVPPTVADSVTQYHMTSAAGTFCYIDPEYQQTGKLTTRSDVYSFGIMLLQIITARPAMGLSHHVRTAIEKGMLEEMLDPAVLDWPVEEALAFAKLALMCAELRKKDRPDLGTVVLPELNRLRDFGSNLESSSGNIHSHGPNSTVASSGPSSPAVSHGPSSPALSPRQGASYETPNDGNDG